MSARTEAEIDIRQRTCADCGHLCDARGEFHPFEFCAMKKGGIRDPWAAFRRMALQVGLDDPGERPIRVWQVRG